MLIGAPRLVTWSLDDNLRGFVLSESGFAQIWTQGFAQHSDALSAGVYPSLNFFNDANIFIGLRALSNTTAYTSVRRLADASEIIGFNWANAAGRGIAHQAFDPETRTSVVVPNGALTLAGSNVRVYDVDGNPIDDASGFGNDDGYHCISIPQTGRFLFTGFDAEKSRLWDITDISTPRQILSEYSRAIRHAEWSFDGNYLLAFSRQSGEPATFFGFDNEGDLVPHFEVFPNVHGNPYNAAFSPNNRHVAISFENSGAFTTLIYERLGKYLFPLQTIPVPMGRLLDFTRDGNLVLDGNSKTALEFSGGSFQVAAGLLTNLPSNVLAQSVSYHAQNYFVTGRLYDGARNDFVLGNVDLGSLKLMLLGDEATFDSDDDLATVTDSGANEVHGSGWAQGGEPLTSVTLSLSSEGFPAFLADDIQRIIYAGNIEFRYAVIVENDETPRIWIDFGSPKEIVANQQVTFDLSTSGILIYSS